MASDRTQQFHIRTAKQVVDTALGEIAPEEAEKFWVSLVQSQIVTQQTHDKAIDFKLSSRCACYKNAGHWGSRTEILSIRDGPLEKFFRRRNFFSYQILCMNFSFGP